MQVVPLLVLLSLIAILSKPVAAAATPEPRSDEPSARCKALPGADFSRIPDALTQVLETKLVPSSDGTVEYCEVRGYVAPSVGFLLRLPTVNWNGKFIQLGCGGTCGTTDERSGMFVFLCGDPLRRGYACIVSDGGNKSSGLDVKWAYNDPQAVIDYRLRANHVTALAGKAIAEHYYSRSPNKSYFMGCSAGGIQAMFEAERFPWDFDGIVAGSPALNTTEVFMNLLWDNRALTDENGETLLGQADLELLHQAVVAKCDLNDGVADGLIGDPRKCHFDPSVLSCTAGKTRRCLTAQQINAVKEIYEGPHTSDGKQIVMPFVQPGSEISWLGWFSGSAQNPTPIYDYIGDHFRYYFFQPNPGPAWKPGSFDFDRDYKRLGMAELAEPANSADLRRFNARGGKLLSFTGWSDPIEGVLRTVDYYETAERIVGGRPATQDFFRLFVIPGMNHCGITDKVGPVIYVADWLTYLEEWVEKGRAPDKIIGARLKDNAGGSRATFPSDPGIVEWSRPTYPYPIDTKYLGHGSPNEAASFGPVQPPKREASAAGISR